MIIESRKYIGGTEVVVGAQISSPFRLDQLFSIVSVCARFNLSVGTAR